MDKLIRGGKQVEAVSFQGKPLGTPSSILDAANRNIAFISWEQEVPTSNSVPHVAQHDLDSCCGTTANNVQNLAYVRQLEDKVKFMDSLIEAYQCDTLYQFARHVSMLAVRCEVLSQQVNQLKGRLQVYEVDKSN